MLAQGAVHSAPARPLALLTAPPHRGGSGPDGLSPHPWGPESRVDRLDHRGHTVALGQTCPLLPRTRYLQGNVKGAAVRRKHQTWQVCGHWQTKVTFPAPSEVPRGSDQADCRQGPRCPGT